MALFFLLLMGSISASQTQEFCDEKFEDSNGIFTSPSYPENYDNDLTCTYQVFAAEGSSHTFTFRDFSLTENSDYVIISCVEDVGFIPVTLTGNEIPRPVSVYSCPTSQVQLLTGQDVTDRGFEIEYQVSVGACGITVYADATGFMASPSYPFDYPTNQNCSYMLWAPVQTRMYLNFQVFSLQDCLDCSCNFVQVTCLDDGKDYGRYCGATIPDDVHIYDCQRAVVWFYSDDSTTGQGFSVDYSIVTWSTENCGKTYYTDTTGIITSPNYPANYDDNLACYYAIQSTNGTGQTLIFLDFQVELAFDYLEVYCPTNSSFSRVRYTGFTIPPVTVVPSCDYVQLYFFSDFIINFAGFMIYYAAIIDDEALCGPLDYTEAHGFAISPFYPLNYINDLDCHYRIDATIASSHTLLFHDFSLQDGQDFLDISCATNDSIPVRQYTGHEIPAPISLPWCAIAQLHLYTDDDMTDRGYIIEYQVSHGGCGNTVFTDFPGTISSPGYPSNYDINQDCSFLIWAERQATTDISFDAFSLPDCPDCSCGFVLIRCFDDGGTDYGIFCGADVPEDIRVDRCQTVLVWFQSDNETVDAGFSLSYSINLPDCGQVDFNENYGLISSPNYPENYYNDIACTYTIYASESSSHTLRFLDFSVPEHIDYVIITCFSNPGFGQIFLTGYQLPVPISIPFCAEAQIHLSTSPNDVTGRGFLIEYQVSDGGCGNTVFRDASGVVTSPSYPFDYSNNQNCSFMLWAPAPIVMYLNFQAFSLQDCSGCSCDFLQVTCLDDNTDYGRYCGNDIPSDIVIDECQRLLVWFHSDDSIIDVGFSASYNILRWSEPSANCGQTFFNESTGVITSPYYPENYDNNMQCYYAIEATNGNRHTLIFHNFLVETFWDFLDVYCATNASFVRRRYTGFALPPVTIIPWCDYVQLFFFTDVSIVYPGFMLTYSVNDNEDVDCGETEFSETHGLISSPFYPFGYVEDLDCTYSVDAAVGSSHTFTFLDFSMQEGFDYIVINCGTNGTIAGVRFTGYLTPPPFSVPWCALAQIHLWTDHTINDRGFNIEYQVSTGGCGDTVFRSPFGTVTSPGYPTSYDNNQNCSFILWSPAPTNMSISFKEFSLQGTCSECSDCDFVQVICKDDGTDYGTYCGADVPDDIQIRDCQTVLVWFHSDDVTIGAGFTAEYTIDLPNIGDCGQTLFTDPTGVITSPNYPAGYEPNLQCYFTIYPPFGNTHTITFTDFEVNNFGDYLEIYCLTNPNVPRRRYSGFILPSVTVVPECFIAQLFLFTNPGDFNNRGFSLSYEASFENYEGTCGTIDFVGTFGFLRSPNYPNNYENNLDCDYTIYAPEGSSHTLIFQAFRVERNFDYVIIRCASNSSYAPLLLTGYDVPPPISISWCSLGQVYFYTDQAVVDTGFSIYFSVSGGGCGNTVFTETSGNVASPGYPSNYNNNQNCTYLIWAPQENLIILYFESFSLQDSVDCSLDFLEIRCSDDFRLLGRYCGTSIPSEIDIEDCQQAQLWFRSDATIVDAGYFARFVIAPPGTCGITSYKDTTGIITSPNYPDGYLNNLRCNFTIYASPDSSHTLIFNSFAVQDNTDYITVSCATNDSYPILTYTGNDIPSPVSIPWCEEAEVYFYTKDDVIDTGFSIDYQVSTGGCGNTVFDAISGTLTSPNFPDNYNNNHNCSYVIAASQPSVINVFFIQFSLESCAGCTCDWVEVRCLDNNSFYGRYCGSALPPQINLACLNTLIWFRTDSIVVDSGFQINYLVVPLSDD